MYALEMGCDGKTVAMPGQRVRGFAAIELYGFIWVWPCTSVPTPLHLLEWAESPDWAYCGGRDHIHCDYRLMVDNLMDLTHETYVRASSIGQKEIDEAPVNTKVVDDEVITSRFMEKIHAPPFWRMALRGNGLPDDQLVDRLQICRFTPPSHVMIEVGVALEGKGGYDALPEHKVSSIVVDFSTPETDTLHHYFWDMARNVKPQDQTSPTRYAKARARSSPRTWKCSSASSKTC